MTWLLLAPAAFLLNTLLVWVFYLAVMHLQEARDAGRIPADAMPYAKAALGFGLAIDLLYNWTWAVILFADLPREFLVTSRLERYKYGKGATPVPATGWRYRLADWFARVLLDPFDPRGVHVRP